MGVAHPDQAFALGPHLREVDKLEMALAYGTTPSAATAILHNSIAESDYAFSICENDVIHGFWGHGKWESPTGKSPLGYVWLVSDDYLFERWAKTMTRYVRSEIFPALDQIYSGYGNSMMLENKVHVRWLLRAGFQPIAKHTVSEHEFVLLMRGEACALPPLR